MNAPAVIHTVGHSTHPIEIFLGLLRDRQIATLADVRSFPSSRRWPQFNQAELERTLAGAGVAYHWMRALGGRRKSSGALSRHCAWEHPAFRAYADYTDTPEFANGLAQLVAIARAAPSAIMCAEGLWWRCHRRIVADHLTVRGWDVRHILPDGKIAAHAIPDFATVVGDRIVYDGGQSALDLS